MGCYVLNASISNCLENLPTGAGGEIELTDALRVHAQMEPVYDCMFEGIRYDTENKLGYLKAIVEFALDSLGLGLQFASYLNDLYHQHNQYTKT